MPKPIPVRLSADIGDYVDKLLAVHRSIFGDTRMEDGGEDGADDQPAEDTEDTSNESGGDDDTHDEDKPLGEKGERALAAEKQKRREAQQQLREYKALGLKPDEIRKLVEGKTDDDTPDPEKIREQARTEARAEVLRDRVTDKIEAKAAGRFALDAEDVAALLMRRHDINDFLDGDKVDAEAIQEALDDLLDKQPGLAAQGKRFQGGADGGTRRQAPQQLTREDLARMTPEQVDKARKEGRLDRLLGVPG